MRLTLASLGKGFDGDAIQGWSLFRPCGMGVIDLGANVASLLASSHRDSVTLGDKSPKSRIRCQPQRAYAA